MSKLAITAILLMLPLFSPTFTNDGPTVIEKMKRLNLDAYAPRGNACMAVYDLVNSIWYNSDLDRCSKRRSPCSTFKIFNTLVGLESGVLENEYTTLKWDGSKQFLRDWERDHTLVSAIRHSVVWYYRSVATGVGASTMQRYLDLAEYGNRDISGGIDTFWLDNSLKISPNEQTIFLKRLYRDDLPFSKRSMAITRGVLMDIEGDDYVLSGKTGSAEDHGAFSLGWFIGHLAHKDQSIVFAFNLECASGLDARALVLKIFADLRILPHDIQNAKPVFIFND